MTDNSDRRLCPGLDMWKDYFMKKLVLLTIALTFSTSLIAAQPPLKLGGGGVTTSSSRGGSVGQLEQVNYGEAMSCDEAYGGYEDFIAFQQFDHITGGHGDKIKISYDDAKGMARLDFPRYMKNCMDIEFHVRKHGKGDYFLAARNKFFDGKAKYSAGEYKDLSTHDKYLKCLDEEKVLPLGGSDYNMDQVEFATPSGLEIELKLKKEGLTNLYFASSKNELGGKDGFNIVNKPSVSEYSDTCFEAEKTQKDSGLVIFKSGAQEEAYARYSDAVDCDTCEFDALAETFRDLDTNAGNASVLDGWMREVFYDPLKEKLLGMLDDRSEKIKKELKNLAGDIKGAKTLDEAEDYVEKYMKLLKELDDKYLSTQIALLEDMYDCEANRRLTDTERDECSKNIKELKTSIKEFGSGYSFGTSVLTKLQNFGLATEAIKIKNFALRSKHYGKYNGKNPDKPLSDISKELIKFSLECEEAERKYLARHEGEVYSDVYKYRVQKDKDSLEDLNEQYSKFVQETQQACQQTGYGYANPKRCKTNAEKAQKLYEAYTTEVKRLKLRINKYGGVYDRYKGLELAYAKDQDDDGDGERSSILDDLFSSSDDDTLSVSRSGGNMFNSASSGQQQQQYSGMYNTSSMYSPYMTGGSFSTGGSMGYNPYMMGGNMGYNSGMMGGSMGYNPYMMGGSSMGYNPYMMGGSMSFGGSGFGELGGNPYMRGGTTNTYTTPGATTPSTGTYSLPAGF